MPKDRDWKKIKILSIYCDIYEQWAYKNYYYKQLEMDSKCLYRQKFSNKNHVIKL